MLRSNVRFPLRGSCCLGSCWLRAGRQNLSKRIESTSPSYVSARADCAGRRTMCSDLHITREWRRGSG